MNNVQGVDPRKRLEWFRWQLSFVMGLSFVGMNSVISPLVKIGFPGAAENVALAIASTVLARLLVNLVAGWSSLLKDQTEEGYDQ